MSKIKKNSIYNAIGFLIPVGIMAAAYPILIKGVGQEEFGIYILATSITGILSFADFGFSTAGIILTADCIKNNNNKGVADIFWVNLYFYISVGFLLMMGLVLFSPSLVSVLKVNSDLSETAILTFRIASVQLFVFMVSTAYFSLLKGMQLFQYTNVATTTLSALVYILSIVGVLKYKISIIELIKISVFCNIAMLIGMAFLTPIIARKENINLFNGAYSKKAFMQSASIGSIMTINSISGIFLGRLQPYLVGILMGPASVTIYNIASSLPGKAHGLIAAATESILPYASGSGNRIDLRKKYKEMMFWSCVISILILLPMGIFAEDIIRLWINEETAIEVFPLLRVFCVSIFFMALSPAPYHLLNGVGKAKINTYFYALNAIINTIILLIFYKFYVLDLYNISLSILISNIIISILYQLYVEIFIWNKL